MNDLPTLDAELYRSLMLLRDYQGDAEDLALNFTITDADLGEHLEVRPPLKFCRYYVEGLGF